jgi:hypothetical protein
MAAVARFVRPGGRALIGAGFWEQPPTPELVEALGDYLDLPDTVARTESGGWLSVYAHVSSLAEWDEYEWSWSGSLARWGAANPGPDGDRALAVSREHRELWLGGYRGVLGFATLLLQRI